MKYLIKYPGRAAIALGAVVMNLINIIRAVKTGEIEEDMIVAFFLALFTLLGLYYNMPTSVEGMEGLEHMNYLKSIEDNEEEEDDEDEY